MKKRNKFRRKLVCECLETRCLLSGFETIDSADFHAAIVAGDPNGTPADSPTLRIDPNTTTSPFAGVGSLRIESTRGTFICTGTPIDANHVLTAAHCVDLNDNGVSNREDGIRSITFNLNLDTDPGTDLVDVAIMATSWRTHPDYTGFSRPSVNDDLAVITLASNVPADVPMYNLVNTDMMAHETHLYLVGYGRSGTGIAGYTTSASYTVKRSGENIADVFTPQDDAFRPAANEVFEFDFDGPSGNGPLGGPSLGNNRETTIGGGDSGGPSFVLVGDPSLPSSYQLAGVNTFTEGALAPLFGSIGGGINIFPYRNWILTGNTGDTRNGGTSANSRRLHTDGSLSKSTDEGFTFIVLPSDIRLDAKVYHASLLTEINALPEVSHATQLAMSSFTPAAFSSATSDMSSDVKRSSPRTKATDHRQGINRDDRFQDLDEIFDLSRLDAVLE